MSKADISKYISQLSPMEQKVLHIAVSHLETSFSLSKSIGFQDWLRAKNKTHSDVSHRIDSLIRILRTRRSASFFASKNDERQGETQTACVSN